MISHVCVGISDFDRALAFYTALFDTLDIPQRFCDHTRPWAAWQPAPGERPLFVIGTPFAGQPAAAGNGQMIALMASDHASVDAAHAAALAHGGSDEGAPGLRPHYHPHYYGAYFRDPDGNKLCVVCHTPPAD